MGKSLLDKNTLWHGAFGVLCSAAGIPVMVSNLVHALVEVLERDVREGVEVESQRNHVGDVVLFAAGSALGARVPALQGTWLELSQVAILVTLVKEIAREL